MQKRQGRRYLVEWENVLWHTKGRERILLEGSEPWKREAQGTKRSFSPPFPSPRGGERRNQFLPPIFLNLFLEAGYGLSLSDFRISASPSIKAFDFYHCASKTTCHSFTISLICCLDKLDNWINPPVDIFKSGKLNKKRLRPSSELLNWVSLTHFFSK